MSTRILGLINARGGSKGIPRKNIKPLGGKPLIAWAIDAGLASKRLTRLIVSTEDPEIADIAQQFGADVPFVRPPELASDAALQIDAIRHALETLSAAGEDYDAVAVLQPTCPLRRSDDIDGALDLLISENADTVISVMEVQGQHPLTMYTRAADGGLTPLMEANQAGVQRQEFPAVWWRNGAVYAIRSAVILEQGTLYGAKVLGYAMPAERSINIDEPLDWMMAEAMVTYLADQAVR
jgi:N-acylneuraminate cytidylyltransferase